MDFEPSDRCKELQERLEAFMAERVYPAAAVYEEQLREAGDPHAQPAVMEELKDDARERRLWNLFHPRRREDPPASGLTSSTRRSRRSWAAATSVPRHATARRRKRATWRC